MISTRLTSLLEIRYPVIQGGMVWVADLLRELERQYHEVVDGLRPGGRTGRRNRR